MRTMWFPVILAIAVSIAPSAIAQTGGSVTLPSYSCPTGYGMDGSAVVEWSAEPGDPNNVALFVYDDGIGYWQLMAAARSGEENVDWIAYMTGYTWELYADLDSNDDLPTGLGGSGPGTFEGSAAIICN